MSGVTQPPEPRHVCRPDPYAPNGSVWTCGTCGVSWVRDVDRSSFDPRTGRGVACFIFDWRRESRRERRRRVRRLPPPPVGAS